MSNYDVIIAGGGPAGSSAAIHLATRGARVLLAEQKKFPRPKLCGEFISPECAGHFEKLGVAEQMLAAGPSNLTETVFYSQSGAKVSVPSDWFASGGAIGLSRAEMDERLLRQASQVGVDVVEDASVINVTSAQAGDVCGMVIRRNGKEESVHAPLSIDATGRARALARFVERDGGTRRPSRRRPMVAFKAHFTGTRIAPGACEIYFYRGGYGGLSSIEQGLSNLCFIVNSSDARKLQSDPDRLVREVVRINRRAEHTLGNAQVETEWLAVSLEGFGRHSPTPANGLLSIGDAASFIDPFTGSGMLMALESGELVANSIGPAIKDLDQTHTLNRIADNYRAAYERHFNSRLRLCSMIRRAAFVPGLAEVAVRAFSFSDAFRRRFARATRRSSNDVAENS